jgi:hypothetical protein
MKNVICSLAENNTSFIAVLAEGTALCVTHTNSPQLTYVLRREKAYVRQVKSKCRGEDR